MNSRAFGPSLWQSMFMIAANYEISIDPKQKEHREKKKFYKTFFTNIGNVIPCSHCRKSYKKYMKELPISKFLNKRNDLMYWLYLIKDKVNKKLIEQYKRGEISYKTVPSPSFKSVCKYYEQFRASCSTKKTKSCSEPLKAEIKLYAK